MVGCVLLVLFPVSSFAADTSAAMLYTNGSAWINGVPVPRPQSAIFSGDLVQTRRDSVANINQAGSSIRVLADSLVEFQGTFLKVEHGAVSVATSRGVGTAAGDVKVTPAANTWTEFDVTDVDGTVRIAARKGDLTVFNGTQTTTLAQGQETTLQENNPEAPDNNGKKKRRAAGAVPGAMGGALNSPYAIGIGAAAIAGITIWVLVQNDDAASPAIP